VSFDTHLQLALKLDFVEMPLGHGNQAVGTDRLFLISFRQRAVMAS
jgi:hypothetical protein